MGLLPRRVKKLRPKKLRKRLKLLYNETYDEAQDRLDESLTYSYPSRTSQNS
jgi:hypothetical protein